jgi:signal transduction histidine kinase/CheY-like chemotaxis protein
LEEENQALRSEVGSLTLQVKKLSREVRTSKSFLDKVMRASEAKDALGNALSAANARQKAYTEMLLENCPSIIILLDENGRFVLSTKELLLATSIPNFDFIKNRDFEDVLGEYFLKNDMESFKKAIDDVSKTNVDIMFDAWVDFSKNSKPKYYSIEFRRANSEEDDLEGSKSSVLVVMIDLTEIVQEKQRAELANRAKSDFLATMSHEIRTPMNAILGMSASLSRANLSDKHRKNVSDIQKAADALMLIINDILDFSKIEAGKMEIISTNYSLKTMLENLKSMFYQICLQKQLEMEFDINSNLPDNAYGDENKLRQILTNILSNAAKYTSEGGVLLSAWLEEDFLRFDIKDSGIGIQEENIDKLFQPFEQIDIHKNRNITGTGLGLAIASSLCELMNGSIWVNSVYGEGSTFSFRIPYIPANDAVIDKRAEVSEFTAPGAKVLVVDDIEINLIVAESMLEIFEIVPDKAEGGAKAIELAKKKDYDLIFMDHMMPEMDGLEATHIIRSINAHNSKVPIIALTANVIKGTEQIFLNNRMDDILPKPIDLLLLNSCLRKWLPKLIIEEAVK